MEQLWYVVETGNITEAESILCRRKRTYLNWTIAKTLLMHVCEKGCVPMVKLLTKYTKADVNQKDSEKRYPISVAVESRNIELASFLLKEKSANPNVRCGMKSRYTTPLIMACKMKDIQMVELLVKNKANVNMVDHLGRTPIWVAIQGSGNNLEMVDFLLQNGANPNVHVKDTNYTGITNTPLLIACHRQQLAMVKLLMKNVSQPADINMANDVGVRPLSVALKSRNMKLVHLLMHADGASIELNYACCIQSVYDGVSGCSKVFRIQNNYTPLKQAIELGNMVLVERMIQAGADVNSKNIIEQNIIDYTPLMDAVFHGDLDMCHFLLQKGANVNATSSPNTHYKTVLTIAVQSNKPDYVDIVELLLKHGATHSQQKCGRSLPMFLAISQQKAVLVDLFMKYGYGFKEYLCPHNPLVTRDELCDAIQTDAEDCCIILLKWGFDISSNNYPYFLKAVEQGMFRLTRMMIELNPQHLQEKWLVLNANPANTWNPNVSELRDHLLMERKHVKTLQELCKATILQDLTFRPKKEYIPTLINSLEFLPTRIKQFLQFQEYDTT